MEGQPAQPSLGGSSVKMEEWGGLLHSQEKSPRYSTARAANGAMEPGLQLGSPSVRNGSGESYPEPSETERRATTTDQNGEGGADKEETVSGDGGFGRGVYGGRDRGRDGGDKIQKDQKL